MHPEIRRFYEETALYGLEVRPKWSGPLRFSARTLIYLVSCDIQQLNPPTSPLDTEAGMSNELIRLVDPATGGTLYTG